MLLAVLIFTKNELLKGQCPGDGILLVAPSACEN